MAYFNFENLINKYSREFIATYTTDNGEYDNKGDFVKGETVKETLTGAIINFKESKIYRSEGTLKTQDKRLFMLKPLKKALIGATVIDNNNTYRIEEESENAMFTGVYAYVLRWVSAFNDWYW